MAEEDLFAQVKAYLTSRGLKPGDKIETETAMAERFGVSRHHIRQVLTVMVQAGILERAPRRGTVIRNFDQTSLSDHIRFQFEVARFDVAEFKEARILVERAVLPLAVRRITPAELAHADKTIEEMLLHLDHPEEADMFDRDFHLLLLQACGNHVLEAFSGVLTTLFRSTDYRRPYWTRERILRIAREHRLILDAIRQGDAQAAVAALDAHLGSVKLGILSR
ncbi:Transcriptional regulator, GntR family [uncultured Alphaproteobacteria bacterium]|uniref:Transcriptional regulator, GntR family n=1 Tax=uncultured Alphaproteobacteria bacterium TaxID=91750 RepID=A0A212JTW4_9PROT|nr:Transcriptional regulator, GntR family [uncultured Alphaproteobacteria bacterium]